MKALDAATARAGAVARTVRVGRLPFLVEAIFMKPFLGAALAILFATSAAGPARADEKDPNAILDKAIKAMGGEEKLKKLDAWTVKTKGTISVNGDSNPFTVASTLQGLDHSRVDFEGEFGGNPLKGVVILNGNKGWRSFNGQKMDMGEDEVANEKRNHYLHVIPAKPLVLKDKGFKLEAADEQKVGDKPAVGIKVTGPDGKDLTIYFDKESGLPVRIVAKVIGFDGEEYTQETTFSGYKDFGGIKAATKVDVKRNGEDLIKSEVTEFKALDTVDAKTFAEP
jgi:hypothetical protein